MTATGAVGLPLRMAPAIDTGSGGSRGGAGGPGAEGCTRRGRLHAGRQTARGRQRARTTAALAETVTATATRRAPTARKTAARAGPVAEDQNATARIRKTRFAARICAIRPVLAAPVSMSRPRLAVPPVTAMRCAGRASAEWFGASRKGRTAQAPRPGAMNSSVEISRMCRWHESDAIGVVLTRLPALAVVVLISASTPHALARGLAGSAD